MLAGAWLVARAAIQERVTLNDAFLLQALHRPVDGRHRNPLVALGDALMKLGRVGMVDRRGENLGDDPPLTRKAHSLGAALRFDPVAHRRHSIRVALANQSQPTFLALATGLQLGGAYSSRIFSDTRTSRVNWISAPISNSSAMTNSNASPCVCGICMKASPNDTIRSVAVHKALSTAR